MEQKGLTEEIRKLHAENPAKFIKIRDALDEIFGDHDLGSAEGISDREFERLRSRFRDIDVPFGWCNTKETVYQLQKAVRNYRAQARGRYEDGSSAKKSAKAKKKGIFGLFQ